MRNDYPILDSNPTMADLARWLNYISQLRSVEDLPDYTNQKNIYVSGRSTTRTPSGATDVVAGDRQGDVVYALDGSYVYVLILVAPDLIWARIPLETTW